MPGLNLVFSNRLEILAQRLASTIKQKPLNKVQSPEIIVVQSLGMARWISLQLAELNGICANMQFPFPNRFASMAFAEFIDDLSEDTEYEKDNLTWRIYQALPSLLTISEFSQVRIYLEDDINDIKLYQLSATLADLFDQYLIYRPNMVKSCSAGADNCWQALLWRNLTENQAITHRTFIKDQFLEKANTGDFKSKLIQERVSVIGISSLPPFHLEILSALSQHIDVFMYLMNPCREYWFDIIPEKISQRIIRRQKSKGTEIEDMYFDKGNSLLASMGKMSRDFFAMINDLESDETALYDDSTSHSLLEMIQSDVLNLVERGQDKSSRTEISPDDKSIEIHASHTPMREIETLYDNLLIAFEKDSQLKPGDILVMTPDIETYTPYIKSVFERSKGNRDFIPYSIADRNLQSQSRAMETLLDIFSLADSRFELSKVMAVLDSQLVKNKFHISNNDMRLIQHWVTAINIRWGLDVKDREAAGYPDYTENTWKFGLDKLLAGYALKNEADNLLVGILPFGDLEGEQLESLSKLLNFFNKLKTSVKSIRQPKSFKKWHGCLTETIDNLMDADTGDEELGIHRLIEILKNFPAYGNRTKSNDEILLEPVKQFIKNQASQSKSRFGFISGAVTFCATLPMRSIPFKIICMVGLNEGNFPRANKTPSFNLMNDKAKPGDRSPRDDDRYIFLEAILSARQKLYLSYLGQSDIDNSILPSSILLSELLDYIENGFYISNREIIDHILTRHRLQAFAPDYYDNNSDLRSFSWPNFETCVKEIEGTSKEHKFIKGRLDIDSEMLNEPISIEQLCLFYANPARYFIQKILKFRLDIKGTEYEDSEAYRLDSLERYFLNNQLLESLLDNKDMKKVFDSVRAEGGLPSGIAGQVEFDHSLLQVGNMVSEIKQSEHSDKLADLNVSYTHAGIELSGCLNRIHEEGYHLYRPARIKAKDYIRAWLHHLLYCHYAPLGYPRQSTFIGLDRILKFDFIENSSEIINKILDFYKSGLTRPLRFFPEHSYKYAELKQGGKPTEYAIKFLENPGSFDDKFQRELSDLYIRRCFGNDNLFDKEFIKLSAAINSPILAEVQESSY